MSKTKRSQPMTLKPQQNQSQLSISATAVFDIDAAADGSSAAALPKFRMVAYTGGPMRLGGWPYPTFVQTHFRLAFCPCCASMKLARRSKQIGSSS
jgi:hypothetical protein